MKQPVEYLVIENVVQPNTRLVVATNKFITPDDSYRQYKAKPNQVFKKDIGLGTVDVIYKIKYLVGVRAIKKHKKILAAFNKIK